VSYIIIGQTRGNDLSGEVRGLQITVIDLIQINEWVLCCKVVHALLHNSNYLYFAMDDAGYIRWASDNGR